MMRHFAYTVVDNVKKKYRKLKIFRKLEKIVD